MLIPGCGQFFPANSGSTGTGGGSTGGSGVSGPFYVGNVNTSLETVAGFSLSGSNLSALTGSPYQMSITPDVMAITPSNSLLFVGSVYGGVYAYTIGTNGALTIANGGIAVDGSDVPVAMAVDPTGAYLLMEQLSGAGTPIVSVFSINATTGGLTVVGNPVTFPQGTTGQLLFVPSTNLVYLSEGSGGVDAMTFSSSTGVLGVLNQHLNLLAGGSADVGLAADPLGKYLFVSETGTNVIRQFTINAGTGAITANGTVSPGLGPNALLVDSTGAYLYAALYGANQVAAYTVSSTGTLTQVSGSPYSTGSLPVALAEDSSHGYLLVGCQGGSPDLQVFSIAATTATVPGSLGSVATSSTGSVSPAVVSALVATH